MAKIEAAFASNNVTSVQNAFDYAADLADEAFVSNTPEAYAKASDFRLKLFAFAEKWDFNLDLIDLSGAPMKELHERRAQAEAAALETQKRHNEVTFVGF
jgi:acetyl-CoA carboxylase alpha subunit